MTPKEAIEYLNIMKLSTEDDSVGEIKKEVCDIAIEALEKQVPKKPLKLTYKPLIDAGWIYACPNCKMACGENKYHLEATSDEMYCPSCGQAIDWSEEE